MRAEPQAVTMGDLNRLIARARLLPSLRAERAFARIRRLVGARLVADPGNSELLLAMGICWYLTPSDSEERSTETRRWLQSALAVAPSLLRANLYLGHILYDEGDYDAALRHLERIPVHAFAAEEQSWRDAKRAELVLAAKAYLGVVELESAVRDLLESYMAMDRSERPVPSELAACVRSLRASSGALPQALSDLLPSLRRLTALASWEALHFREPS